MKNKTKMTAEEFIKEKCGESFLYTEKEVFDSMEEYARHKIEEFLKFYNNRQLRINTVPIKDEMEIFYGEN